MNNKVCFGCPICKGELRGELDCEYFTCEICTVTWRQEELKEVEQLDTVIGQSEQPKVDDETGPIGSKQDVARIMLQMSIIFKEERTNIVINALTNMLAHTVMGSVKDEYRAGIKDDILGQLKKCLDKFDE